MRTPHRGSPLRPLRTGFGVLLTVLVFGGAGGLLPRSVLAGGLNLYEVGSPDTGLAGAGYAARAQDPATVFTNPAGMTRLDGTRFLLGIQPLYVDLGFESDRNTTVSGGDGGNAGGLVPSGSSFLVHGLSPDLKIGFGMFSYFGLGIDYGSSWVGRYYVQEAFLAGLSFMPAAALRIDDRFSVGAGLNAMYGMFSMDVGVNNVRDGLGDGKLTIEDGTWGFGGNFGVLFEATPATRFGLTYLTPVSLDFEDSPKFRNLGPAFDGILERRDFRSLSLDMTVPQSLMASVYHELDDQFAVLGNVGWQDWSRFGRVGVGVESDESQSLTADRNYRDTFNFAVGLQVRPAPGWVLSTGVAYDTSMVKDRDRTPDTPSGATLRFGLGAQVEISESFTLGLAYALVAVEDMPLDQERGPLSGRLSGKYRDGRIHVLTISLMWKL